MLVQQVMSQPVVICHPGDSVNEAARLMWEQDCGAVPVVDEAGRAVAMLTDRDVCMAAYIQGRLLREIQVRSVMSKELHACTPEDSLVKAAQLMQQHQVRRIPVVDPEGRPVGILSLNDLVRVATKQHPAAHGLVDGVSSSSLAQTLSAVGAPRSCDMDAPLL